ncbi:hypothetical protein FIBSPDRAFT_871378, partial [Athelia psychrophila]
MATTPPPQIKVYIPLPLTVALDLNVDPTNWRWAHCLTIPLEKLAALQLSRRPYKWIRYAIGAVVGAEGVLSTSSDSHNAVEEDTVTLPESADLYYHISDEEKRRIFLVDTHARHTNVTSSVQTNLRIDFREDVARRDGGRCILIGYPGYVCDAVHLLPHSKGDEYIETYTKRRSRDPDEEDIIREIDNTRNGLFLNKSAHPALGRDLAFLVTPNFAMNTTDIDPTASPTAKRFTSHVFDSNIPPAFFKGSFQISDTSESPPAILFDAVYASAVLHHFGAPTLENDISAAWKDALCPTMNVKTKQDQDQERDKRHEVRREARQRFDAFDVILALPYILTSREEVQAVLTEAKDNAEAAEQSCGREKVDAWMKQIPAYSLH